MNQRRQPRCSPTAGITRDRLSNLPKHIIDYILSCLPIRDAVRTSILSKEWRNKWFSIPVLAFDNKCAGGRYFPSDKLVKIVDTVLLLHVGPIQRFIIRNLCGTNDINRWILILSRVSVKEIVLCVSWGPLYKMHSSLFNCKDLTQLTLCRCSLDLPLTFDGFKNLVSLHLQEVELDQDVLECLISTHPALKRLSLGNLLGVTHVNINAPNLQSLGLGGAFQDFTLGVMNHLKSVTIDFHDDGGDTADKQSHAYTDTSYHKSFFLNLHKTQRLALEKYSLKFLAVGQVPQTLPVLHCDLEYLFIRINFASAEELATVMYLLRGSPKLKKVVFESRSENGTVTGPPNNFWEDERSCEPFRQLKVVSVIDIDGNKPEMDFIRTLLSSSPELQTLTVQQNGWKGKDGEVMLLKQLLRLRRASTQAEVIVLNRR